MVDSVGSSVNDRGVPISHMLVAMDTPSRLLETQQVSKDKDKRYLIRTL